jgi:hypothetical protein
MRRRTVLLDTDSSPAASGTVSMGDRRDIAGRGVPSREVPRGGGTAAGSAPAVEGVLVGRERGGRVERRLVTEGSPGFGEHRVPPKPRAPPVGREPAPGGVARGPPPHLRQRPKAWLSVAATRGHGSLGARKAGKGRWAGMSPTLASRLLFGPPCRQGFCQILTEKDKAARR